MTYSISRLLTISDCDQAIAMAIERKNDLIFEQTVSYRELSDKEKSTALNQANLASTKAEITGTEAAIATLPDGESKRDLQSKLRRLNDRRENLEERLNKGGSASVLDTELDAGLLEAQVAEIGLYIEAVQNRKKEIK